MPHAVMGAVVVMGVYAVYRLLRTKRSDKQSTE